MLRQADAILLDELKQSGWYRKTSQAFAVLLPVQSVGVMGDGRTYENAIALRAVQTDDFMTADWSQLPYDLLAQDFDAHHQLGGGGQPRCLRYHQQAAGDD